MMNLPRLDQHDTQRRLTSRGLTTSYNVIQFLRNVHLVEEHLPVSRLVG
jgi:hypothetical protein